MRLSLDFRRAIKAAQSGAGALVPPMARGFAIDSQDDHTGLRSATAQTSGTPLPILCGELADGGTLTPS